MIRLSVPLIGTSVIATATWIKPRRRILVNGIVTRPFTNLKLDDCIIRVLNWHDFVFYQIQAVCYTVTITSRGVRPFGEKRRKCGISGTAWRSNAQAGSQARKIKHTNMSKSRLEKTAVSISVIAPLLGTVYAIYLL